MVEPQALGGRSSWRETQVQVAGEVGWEGALVIQVGEPSRGQVGLGVHSSAQTPASGFISCVTLSKTVEQPQFTWSVKWAGNVK